MRSCCSGAELQVWRVDAEPGRADADGLRRPVSRPRVDWDSAVIELRELYPTRSDVYERARALETAYRESFAPPNARP